MTMKARFVLTMTVVCMMLAFAGCGSGEESSTVSSRAYKGHNSDVDTNNLVRTYPALVGTRLDDCQTCHRGGTVTQNEKEVTLNQCDFCHQLVFADPKPVGAPESYADTLNLYGKDYLAAGRTKAAVKSIEDKDSDADTYANKDEIDALRYPGDEHSYPGQTLAPIMTLTWADITALTQKTQFLLLNANKQAEDSYVSYEGVSVLDLLNSTGIDLSQATGITMFSEDGFTQSYSMEQLQGTYPGQLFYAGLEKGGSLLYEKGFVTYPDQSVWPEGMTDRGVIPGDHLLMLALKRDGGQLLEGGYLDTVSGKIGGEGPYRGIIPQSTPGRPDRGRNETPVGDEWDYGDTLDHNAGSCPKVVVAIRIDPMPAGLEEFDWKNGAWSLVDARELIIYGLGVTAR